MDFAPCAPTRFAAAAFRRRRAPSAEGARLSSPPRGDGTIQVTTATAATPSHAEDRSARLLCRSRVRIVLAVPIEHHSLQRAHPSCSSAGHHRRLWAARHALEGRWRTQARTSRASAEQPQLIAHTLIFHLEVPQAARTRLPSRRRPPPPPRGCSCCSSSCASVRGFRRSSRASLCASSRTPSPPSYPHFCQREA